MAKKKARAKPYRRGVGIVLINDKGRVFVAERLDTPGAWQMPQGGIDKGETPIEAAWREMKEEVGTDRAELGRAEGERADRLARVEGSRARCHRRRAAGQADEKAGPDRTGVCG